MIAIVIPFVVLLILVCVKKIPFVGGKVHWALIITGVLVMLMTKHYTPGDWVGAIGEGLNRFLWIVLFCAVVNIYAECMIRLGVIEGMMRILGAIFGKSSRALLAASVITMVFIGAFAGSTSTCTVLVGVFMAEVLYKQGLSAERVTATLVMGSSIGSLMPPVSFSFNTAASTLNVDVLEVFRYGYVLASISTVFILIYIVFILAPKSIGQKSDGQTELPKEKEHVGAIFKEIWVRMLPMFLLIALIVLNSFGINITMMTIGLLFKWASDIYILNNLYNFLNLTFLLIIIICCCFKEVRSNIPEIVVTGCKRSGTALLILLASSFMVGCFVTSGGTDIVAQWASTLNSTALIFGGAAAMLLLGMLTGSNGTAITVIAPFYGPALSALGIAGPKIAAAIGLFASAGQGLPPADNNTFVACALVTGLLGGKKIEPIKVMTICIPSCLLLTLMGLVLLYI